MSLPVTSLRYLDPDLHFFINQIVSSVTISLKFDEALNVNVTKSQTNLGPCSYTHLLDENPT